MATFSQRLSGSNNDGDKHGSTWLRGGSNLWVGELSGSWDLAVRFTNVTISSGSTISDARITFETDGDAPESGSLRSTISGIDEDNTADFYNDPMGRSKTSADKAWDFTVDGGSGHEYTTVNLKDIVGEIISRPGWAKGNAMGFFFEDDSSDSGIVGSFYSVDGNSSKCAYLTITYTPIASPSPSASPSASVSPSSSVSPSVSPSVSVSPSPSASVSPSPSASISPSSSLSPSLPPMDYGLKITKSGYDVKTEEDIKNMVFTSAKGILGLRQLTSYTKTTDANGNINATEAHGFGYTPITIASFTTYTSVAPDSLVDGVRALCPVEWHTFYFNASHETIEVTETVTFSIDTSSIRFIVHAEGYNVDTDTAANISGREYTFNVYYYFNELVETA